MFQLDVMCVVCLFYVNLLFMFRRCFAGAAGVCVVESPVEGRFFLRLRGDLSNLALKTLSKLHKVTQASLFIHLPSPALLV